MDEEGKIIAESDMDDKKETLSDTEKASDAYAGASTGPSLINTQSRPVDCVPAAPRRFWFRLRKQSSDVNMTTA